MMRVTVRGIRLAGFKVNWYLNQWFGNATLDVSLLSILLMLAVLQYDNAPEYALLFGVLLACLMFIWLITRIILSLFILVLGFYLPREQRPIRLTRKTEWVPRESRRSRKQRRSPPADPLPLPVEA